MRRITLWMLSTVTTLVLLFSYHTSTSSSGTVVAAAAVPGTTNGSSGTSGGTTGSATSGSSGTFSGDTAQTQWGPVQVQITVENGSITAADVLQIPSGSHRDEQINSYAVPILNQEVVTAQSAGIDTISGATVTSDGYVQSLQSAIDQAHL